MSTVVPQGALQAAQRYGRLVDPIAAGYVNPLTGKPLSGEALLLKLSKGENGFQLGGAPSSAGARGPTQFTPESRAVVLKKYGIDPWRSYGEAFHAAALHLLGKVNGSKGLEGYNPGMPTYASYILGQRIGRVGGARGGTGAGSAPGGAAGGTLTDGAPAQQPAGVAEGSTGVLDLVKALTSQAQPRATAGVAPPAFSARAALPQGYAAPSSGGGPAAKPDISALVDAIQTQGGDVPTASQVAGPSTFTAGAAGAPGGASQVTALKGIGKFDGKPVAAWIAPVLAYARKHGWQGTVNSGYRDPKEKVTPGPGLPVAPQGHSNHNFTGYPGGAVDVSDAEQLARILRRSPYAGKLVWAGGKDPVHFSHPHNGSY